MSTKYLQQNMGYRFFSSGVNCVYYGLKESIFIEVEDLRISGRKKELSDFRIDRTVCYTYLVSAMSSRLNGYSV
jgi:hypothetical protein